MAQCTTGKSFHLSTTLDHNPFMVSTLADGRPKQPDAAAFSKEIIHDPVLGREIFVQQTPMGPIATVPTLLPSQLGVVNVTEAYNQTVKKLINHVPTSSAILRDSNVIARCAKDGLYYPAKVQEHVEGNTFVVEFDADYMANNLRMQTTGAYDMIAADDAMRHSVGEGDCCLAPVDAGYAPYAVGKILYDDAVSESEFTVQFAHGLKRGVPLDKVCWIPSVLYDRIVAELKSPQARIQTLEMAHTTVPQHPLDQFLAGTPKYALNSGVHLPPNVVSRAWCPVSYQGYRYIPTFPVPWLPHFWPNDINLWPQYLLPFRRTFAAVETNQRLPGIKMSVNELDVKVDGTLNESAKVLESTSGNYLDRMESFMSKHDNATLEQLVKDDDNDDYVVDIEWNIPQKETCDIGENTVVSVKNHLCRLARQARRPVVERPPWKKYVRVEDEKHNPSVIHSGKFETASANIHGYSDDDYTIHRLHEKQLKTLSSLHERKTKFLVNEACRMKEQESELLEKIDSLHAKVDIAESKFFVQ